MLTYFIQTKVLRRFLFPAFTLTAIALLSACISSQPYPLGTVTAQPIPTPVVRLPKLGQEWVYNVRNVFSQELVDTVTERVVSVGEQVRIQRSGVKAGPLPDEIQSPWGYILQDARWSPPQKFVNPISLWPEQLTLGFNQFYKTRYQVLGYPDSTYYWGMSMKVTQWELIKGPAMRCLTLRVMTFSGWAIFAKKMSGFPPKSVAGSFAEALGVTSLMVSPGPMPIGKTTSSGSLCPGGRLSA